MSRKSEASSGPSYNPLESLITFYNECSETGVEIRRKLEVGGIFCLLRFYEPCKLLYGFTKLAEFCEPFFCNLNPFLSRAIQITSENNVEKKNELNLTVS